MHCLPSPLLHLVGLAGLLGCLQGGWAAAQTPTAEAILGGSTSLLKAEGGPDQHLNGFFLGGRVLFSPSWSLAATLDRETGSTAYGVELRQIAAVLGPRFSQPLSDRITGFAQVLVGAAQFTPGNGSGEHNSSLALEPGVGVDFALTRQMYLRAQADEVLTRYAVASQRTPRYSLGLGWSWGRGGNPAAVPAAVLPPAPEPPPEPPTAAPAAPAPAPVLAPAIPPPAPRPMLVEVRVHFGPGQSVLSEAGRQALQRMADGIRQQGDGLTVQLSGHASRIGHHNRALSLRRAEAVAAALVQAGLPKAAIQVRAASFDEPLAPDTTLENRARNRRVEALIQLGSRTDLATQKIDVP